jgi:hypothetical protein
VIVAELEHWGYGLTGLQAAGGPQARALVGGLIRGLLLIRRGESDLVVRQDYGQAADRLTQASAATMRGSPSV